MFLTGVSFPPDWPVYSETLIKLSVYGENNGHQQTVSKEATLSTLMRSELHTALVSVPFTFACADLSLVHGFVVVPSLCG